MHKHTLFVVTHTDICSKHTIYQFPNQPYCLDQKNSGNGKFPWRNLPWIIFGDFLVMVRYCHCYNEKIRCFSRRNAIMRDIDNILITTALLQVCVTIHVRGYLLAIYWRNNKNITRITCKFSNDYRSHLTIFVILNVVTVD